MILTGFEYWVLSFELSQLRAAIPRRFLRSAKPHHRSRLQTQNSKPKTQNLIGRLFVLAFGLVATAIAQSPTYERDVVPLLQKYCYECHDENVHKADLA